jgi:hypothetical protein
MIGMKGAFILLFAVFIGLFGGVGIASYGSAPVASSGTLVLFGSGLVGLALWGRRKFRR